MPARFARAANQEIVGSTTQAMRRLDLRRVTDRDAAAVVVKVHWSRRGVERLKSFERLLTMNETEMSIRQESANLACIFHEGFTSQGKRAQVSCSRFAMPSG